MWEKVAALMAKKNVSIAQLAEKTGIPATTIYTWKNSKNKKIVKVETLMLIAKFLEVPITELM